MGLLESRSLNFKNVLILGANEGTLPRGNKDISSIPFDVKKQFGLPTFMENDAIYAYHFYRLIQEAENIHITFLESDTGLIQEKSRFLLQLEAESGHQIKKVFPKIPQSLTPVDIHLIPKTEFILEKLNRWKMRISASSIYLYFKSQQEFYMRYILQVYEPENIKELDARLKGKLIHEILSIIYKPFVDTYLSAEALKKALDNLQYYFSQGIKLLKLDLEFINEGQNYIELTTAFDICKAVLQKDLEDVVAGHRICIVGIELDFADVRFTLNQETREQVYFSGIIDRLDIFDSQIRVIDYKSSTMKIPKSISTKTSNDKIKGARQLFIYVMAVEQLYFEKLSKQHPDNSFELTTGFWVLNLTQDGFIAELSPTSALISDLNEEIRAVITEILDPSIDFDLNKKTETY